MQCDDLHIMVLWNDHEVAPRGSPLSRLTVLIHDFIRLSDLSSARAYLNTDSDAALLASTVNFMLLHRTQKSLKSIRSGTCFVSSQSAEAYCTTISGYVLDVGSLLFYVYRGVLHACFQRTWNVICVKAV